MIKKIVLISLLFLGIVNAATITTDKNTYNSNENVVTTFSAMSGDDEDWIAIYPAGSNNNWGNVIQWSWAGAVNGNHTFTALPAGDYEARAFFNNSYNLEASKAFSVENNGNNDPVILTLNKESYSPNESPVLTFSNMSGNNKDWIAIYPAGSNNNWANVLQWDWAGAVNGNHTFNALPVGNYEVRAFFNNSYNLEASKAFSVEAQIAVGLTTSSDVYGSDESPVALYQNMTGNDGDWIGIYPEGSTNAWGNMIQWAWVNSVNGSHVFDALPLGNYEVRVFFNDSLNSEATKSFSVQDLPVESTVYENAEGGLSANWIHISGNYAPLHYGNGGFESTGALVLTPQWENLAAGWTNHSEYRLPLNADASKKVLELDVGGLGNYKLQNGSRKGYMPHYKITVRIQTTNGARRINWDSFYNHNGITEPFPSAGGSVINSPSPVEHVRGWYEPDVFKWEHFKVNIENVLRKVEPDNSVTSIDSISFTGGFLDNIKLSNR